MNIITPEIEKDLYKYIAGILRNLNCPALIVGGHKNHIHILISLSRTLTISTVLQKVKKDSSKWVKTKGNKYRKFYWQNGYGVFSVSQSQIDSVITYIENQKYHHSKKVFKKEYLELLQKHKVEYDERFIWD
jgi:REP element-mobilizing transposase RayT